MGYSVSLSANGNTLAFGGPDDSSNIGAVWLYTRNSSGVWSEQQKITPTGYTGTPYFGTSVSLSGDGTTLAVGANGYNSHEGATWIFTQNSSGIWTQGPILIGSSVANSYQGCSVSLSNTGTILAVGGYGDASYIGATWIFFSNG